MFPKDFANLAQIGLSGEEERKDINSIEENKDSFMFKNRNTFELLKAFDPFKSNNVS